MIKKKLLGIMAAILIALTGIVPAASLAMPVTVLAAEAKTRTKETGLYKEAGVWKYFENGKFSRKSGLAKKAADGKWYYVKKGVYDKKTTCLAKKLGTEDEAWYYVKKGKIKTLSKAAWVKPSKGSYDFYISKKGKVRKIRPKAGKITWIGDCLTVAMKQTPAVKSKYDFTFSSTNTFAHVSKSWTYAGVGGMDGKDTLDSLVRSKKLKPYLVMALGQNLAGFATKKEMNSQVDYIMKKAGKKTSVVFMTTILTWGNTGERLNYNSVLRKKAKQYDNMYVADWANTVKRKWFTDRAHFTWEGNAQLFNCLMTQVMEAAKKNFNEEKQNQTSVVIK